MRKACILWIVSILLIGSVFSAFALQPANAELLDEYEWLLKGTWTVVYRADDTWSGLGREIVFSEESGYMLFITSTNEVYIAWGVDASNQAHRISYTAEIAFSADGNYLMLIRNDDSVILKRK